MEQLAAQDHFVPTMIANAPAVGEAEFGQEFAEIICKYLFAGQTLTMFGCYVVRGIRLGCDRGAKAIRNQFGAFDVVQPNAFGMVEQTSLQATPPQTPRAAEAMSILGTPRPVSAILLMLEAQVADRDRIPGDGQERLQVSARVQHFEQIQQQLLPQQPQPQRQQQTEQKQQEIDNEVTDRLRQIAVGKWQVEHEQTPTSNEHIDES